MKKIVKIWGTMLVVFSIFTITSFAATGTINTDKARIRQRATTDSPEVSVATRGEKVEVLGEENGWYQVKFETVTGYIRADLISTDYSAPATPTETPAAPEAPAEPTPTPETISEPAPATEQPAAEPEEQTPTNTFVERTVNIGESVTLNKDITLRYLPNFYSRASSNIAAGSNVSVRDELNHWIKVSNGDVTGWILKADISENQQVSPEAPAEPTPTPEPAPSGTAIDPTPAPLNETKKGHVNVPSAVVREEPDGKKLASLSQNTVVEIIGEVEDWYQINVEGYNGSYIAKRLITLD